MRDLTVNASGSGDVDLRTLKAGSLNITMNGPGDVSANGITQDVNLVVSGSGDLDIGDMQRPKINAAMHGPGSVTLRGTAKESAPRWPARAIWKRARCRPTPPAPCCTAPGESLPGLATSRNSTPKCTARAT